MRIAICTTQVPFVSGGAELHAHNLAEALRQHGHEAEIISLPFKWYPANEIVRNMLAWQLLDISESNGQKIDLVIGLKFPAYLVNHPNKVLWILHQYRQAYELWTGPFADLSHDPDGARVRDIIVHADNRSIREARRVFANSHNVAERLRRFNGIIAAPLYHPPPHSQLFECHSYGNFVFYPSRLDATKRQSLLIQAMSYTRTEAKCVIAGTGPLESELRKQISALGLRDRVTLMGRIPVEQLIDYYANARAVFFGPFDEDYGYVTLESFLSQKCVVTLTDSGGPLEFVQSGINGFVLQPEPRVIAHTIDQLFAEPSLAQELGRRGASLLRERDISWSNVVHTLLS